MTPAGVMPSGPDNTVVLDGDAATADSAAVTVEQAGEEPAAPQGPILAAFELRRLRRIARPTRASPSSAPASPG